VGGASRHPWGGGDRVEDRRQARAARVAGEVRDGGILQVCVGCSVKTFALRCGRLCALQQLKGGRNGWSEPGRTSRGVSAKGTMPLFDLMRSQRFLPALCFQLLRCSASRSLRLVCRRTGPCCCSRPGLGWWLRRLDGESHAISLHAVEMVLGVSTWRPGPSEFVQDRFVWQSSRLPSCLPAVFESAQIKFRGQETLLRAGSV